MRFPPRIKDFVENEKWTFAKTMPDWPHEYLVRDRVDGELFETTVAHIRSFGYQGSFYAKPITYFAEDEMIYWTMGAPIELTTIINRCAERDSYETRLRNGTLPRSSSKKVGNG